MSHQMQQMAEHAKEHIKESKLEVTVLVLFLFLCFVIGVFVCLGMNSTAVSSDGTDGRACKRAHQRIKTRGQFLCLVIGTFVWLDQFGYEFYSCLIR